MLSGNVIRAGAGSAIVPRTAPKIARELRDASAEAMGIVARAERRAAELLAEAERERAERFTASEEQGYAAGLAQWNEALAEAWHGRDEYLRRNEGELVKLAVAAAAQIVGAAAEADPGTVLRQARKAVKASAAGRRLTLKVHPSEEDWVRANLGTIEGLDGAVVTTLDAVEPGGCIVETEIGSVDARLGTQMAAMEKALLRRAHASRS